MSRQQRPRLRISDTPNATQRLGSPSPNDLPGPPHPRQTSSQALRACVDGTGPSISSVDIDAATSSWTEGNDVLTSGSIGGANVSVGDPIEAPIPSTTGTFLSCSSGSASVIVTSNPTAPGAADLETTGLSLGTCTQSGANANVSFGLPSSGSVSDAVGLAFSLGTVPVSVSVPTFHEMCGYTADLSGGASNVTNAATFSNRPLKLPAVPFSVRKSE